MKYRKGGLNKMDDKTFKEELLEVWKRELEELSGMDPNDNKEAYRVKSERVTSIERQLTDLEKQELDVEARAASQDIDVAEKSKQSELDERDRKARHRFDIINMAAPLAAAIVMGVVTMKWEKFDTMTSTAGKASWRDVIKFRK